MTGCGASGWEEVEQNEFLYDCIQAGEGAKNCSCILECLENNYNSYEEIMNEILLIGVSKKTAHCTDRCAPNFTPLPESK